MSQTVRTDDGVRLAYRVVGEGSRNLVLLSAWGFSGAAWDACLPFLAQHDLRIIVPDIRGTGASDRTLEGHTLRRLAQDVAAVASAAGAERYVVLGHSMGAKLARLVAAAQSTRVEGLVLVCPAPAEPMVVPPPLAELLRSIPGNAAGMWMLMGLSCTVMPPPAVRQALLADVGANTPEALRKQLEVVLFSESVVAEQERIAAPTLFVATDDLVFTPEIVAAQAKGIRGAKVVVLPGNGGHFVNFEGPGALAAVVRAFCAGLK